MIKVIVALSGGVDSSFAAWLLIQKGYMVEGVCLDLFGGSEAPERALDVGERLGIRVHILDRKQRFQEEIIDDFCRSYHAGLTPNPCAACNPLIKFGSLLEFAAEHGAEKIATGHYARCIQDQDTGIHNLYKGLDARKDQSYFLYHLDQEVLQKTIFPLGESTKTEVRAAAAIAGLPMAAAKDSQEICFIPDGDYIGFLRRRANGADKAGGLISDGLILDDLIASGLTSDGLIARKLIHSGLI
ncbi:MAG: hypothetical protein LBH09_07495, partial [Peptococcaceae bacterium]|nr:hypothetical protein [Peptococcaceae bacterium]